MTNKITIGADPEFFVSRNGALVSAHGLVQGDKKNPLPVNKGAVQVDGMALEFNIDPANSAQEFDFHITAVLQALREMVPAEYEFKVQPVANFGAEYIAAQPEEAKELGCEPDFNAYQEGAVNPTPDANGDFRTAAGHVHIGIERDLDDMQKCMLAILCDLTMGLPSLTYDQDKKRRELYGRAGCLRFKPYGIEYRTLSNAWVGDPNLRRLVHDGAVLAAKSLDNFSDIFNFNEAETGFVYQDLERIINESDLESAIKIMVAFEKFEEA